ncbi:MAG: LCP family protein [Actinomycetales bacterium]
MSGTSTEILPEGNGTPAKRRHILRNILLSVGAVLLIGSLSAGAFAFGLAHAFDSKVAKIASPFPADALRPKPVAPAASAPPSASAAATTAMNILVIGSDSRDTSQSAAEQKAAGNQRSDTLMWVNIPADRKSINVMSIMRDNWTTIPGFGEAKINAAYAFGGVPLVVQTVEGLFGVRIDHVAVMDFEGFKSLTTALGGVPVDVPLSFTSKNMAGYTYTAGPMTLQGDQALAFVRERYSFPDSDYQRVKDQQAFVKGLLSKLSSGGTLTDPAKLLATIDSLKGYLSVDDGLDSAAVAALAVQLKDVKRSDIHTFTLPTKGTGTSSDGQSIVIMDMGAVYGIGKAMAADSLGQYLVANGL